MFKIMWISLKKKFHVGGSITQTTRYVELIAKMVFWWIYNQELQTHSHVEVFKRLFDLTDESTKPSQS